MTIQTQSNIISRFFSGIQKLITDLMPALAQSPKERAVRMWDIMSFVQKELDAQGTPNEFGETYPAGYVLDGYIDESGTFVIVTRSDGKLYKIPVLIDAQSQMTLGTEAEVFMEFTPVARSLMISREKGTDGKETGVVRWFAMPACTAFLNRSGEIDSRALFDSMVEYAERQNDYPELDFYHLGERMVLGRADLLFRDDVNFCATGLFDDTPIARAAIDSIEKNGGYWGLSIAYLPTKEAEKIRSAEGLEIPVFNDGICRFISLLPEDTAASILTSMSIKEEVNRMNENVKAALKKLTESNPALLTEIMENLKENNRAAEQPGVIVREATPAAAPVAATPAPVTASVPAEPAKKREFSADDLEAIFGSDAFKNAVGGIVTELRKAESATDETPAPETTPEAEAGEERALAAMLREILGKLETAEQSREAEVQQVLSDLPGKIAQAKIIRPRNTATLQPDQLESKERRSLPLDQIASRTLEKMGAAE